jgi:hypothetical protein
LRSAKDTGLAARVINLQLPCLGPNTVLLKTMRDRFADLNEVILGERKHTRTCTTQSQAK